MGHLKEFTGRCCGKRRTKSRNSSRSTAPHWLPIIRQVATSPQTALPSVRQPKKTVVNNASRCLNRFSPSARRARPPHHAAHRAACQTALVRIETTVAPSNLLPSRVMQAARSIENRTHTARFLTLAGSSNRARTFTPSAFAPAASVAIRGTADIRRMTLMTKQSNSLPRWTPVPTDHI